MPLLRFEIWSDDSGEFAFEVSAQNDRVRIATMPQAVLAHGYWAASQFEAFQRSNDFHGYGKWAPPEGLKDRNFTHAEVKAQQSYLANRRPT